ncbi:MAG: hypothetical protein ACUVT9_05480 [Candidatus Bathycorpusculaceae bacterium]
MWDIFFGIFGNIVFDVLLLIFLLVGMIVGLLWKPSWTHKVVKFIPREHRFVEFPIEHEYAHSIECKEVKGYPPQRFYKYRPGWIGAIGRVIKRPSTIFLAKEGTAYTWGLQGNPNREPIKIGKLSDAIQTVLGKRFYDLMPDDAKEKLEESRINVTVELEEGTTPEDYRPASEEEILTEEDRKAAETYWAGKKEAEKGALLNVIITILAGVGIGFIIAWLLKVGGTTVVEQPTAQAIMFMVKSLFG